MPYIDPTNQNAGCSSSPQPDLGLTEYVDEYLMPITIPQSVTAAQGGIALIRAGKMESVTAVADAPSTPPDVAWAFNRAQTWERRSPMLTYLASKAGISDTELDDLFIMAASIRP